MSDCCENSDVCLYTAIVMEWSSGQYVQCGSNWIKINYISHSTPKRYRPPPIESPNLSRIETPIQNVDEELAALMKKLKI